MNGSTGDGGIEDGASAQRKQACCSLVSEMKIAGKKKNIYKGGKTVSLRNKAIISAILFASICLLVCPALGVVAATPTLSINQLVTSGQTVTLQAPSGDYLYQWTAITGGSTIGAGTAQKFTFTAPEVTQEDGSKTVTITLYIRTTEGGCVNQTATDINVYPLPVCGISGPGQVGPYETATYSYTGGTTGTLTFEWTVDGKKIDGATGDSVDIDWGQYNPVNHTVGMTLTKDYSDVAPGSTNPFRSVSCSLKTNVTYTTGLEVTKQPSSTSAAVGETVTYTYSVRNTGTIGITSLALKDNKLGNINLGSTTLLPGAETSATATYTIKESDLPGPLNNTVAASGKEDMTNKPVSATANASVALTYNAAITVAKVPSSAAASVGETVTYTYTINNTGNVTVKGLTLSDDKLGPVNINKKDLAPGETTTATATHVVVETDLPGPLNNTATVAGTDSQGGAVTAQATASVTLSYTSSLAVTKTPSPANAAVGDTITYSYEVRNTGTITINDLALSDDRLGGITLDKTSLAAGDTATGSITYQVVETDLPGPLNNTATATGTDMQGGAVTAQATASVKLSYVASMQVTKTPSVQTAKVGDTVTYSYTVSNTGTVTISNLALSDDKLGIISLGSNSIAPGESLTGTASYTILETDLAGPLTNTATATGTDRLGVGVTAQATASVALTYTASLLVTKTPSSATAAIGDIITYQYVVENTGNVTVNALTLVDDRLGGVTLDRDSLGPGEQATGSIDYTVVETDLPGPLTNTATAPGTDILGKAVSSKASASVDLTYTASLQVVKTPSPDSAAVGDTITYTYTVTNTGTVSIKGLKLSDDKLKAITVDKTDLLPGETATGTATHVVVEADLPGPLTNTVTATATDAAGKSVTTTATATVTLTYTATLDVTKTASPEQANVGETITYSYTVRNTGTVTINNLALIDNRLGDIKINKKSLKPDEEATGSATYTVVEGDLPGPLVNTVTATATDSQNQQVTATATASVPLSYTASLAVTKEPSANSGAIGDTITYSYTITNTGSVTISGLTLSDNKLGNIVPAMDTLAAGESTSASFDHILAESDLPSPLTNTVTATATDIQNQQVTATASASVEMTYTAALQLSKVASSKSAKVGETVTYTYSITNSGTVTLSSLVLTDNKLGTVSLPKDSIAPGETITGTATYTIAVEDVPGPVVNTAQVTGQDPSGNEISSGEASQTVTVTRDPVTPELTCVADNGNGTYTAYFGYTNPNSYAVTIAESNDNRFTPKPESRGQPTVFEPGTQTAVFAVLSDGNALVWHLDGKVAEANKNSQGCSQASCSMDGPEALCRNKVETYSYTGQEDSQFTQQYEWFMDDQSIGTGKSLDISGSNFELGEHTLKVKVTRYYNGNLWSAAECSMNIKVIPEPSADISMEEES